MGRFVYATVVGLVGAAVVHLVVLLLLPLVSERDAWSRLAARGALYETVALGDAGDGDPLFRTVACRFDLSDGPLGLEGEGRSPFWSVSVHDREGHSLFSVSDRTLAGRLDIQILDPGQSVAARAAAALEADAPVRFQADTEQGIAVLRAFVPDPTWAPAVDGLIASFRCATLPEG